MIVDARGRLFGRINLFDALVLAFLLGLVPVAYATFLLFRPARPSIASVDRVEITREERRLAGGSLMLAKLKVRGTGFSPTLRASLGSTPALGFVFENPNTADVLVGDLPPGRHDLVLLDGVQEVARATDALTIEPTPVRRIRAVGHFVNLTKEHAAALTPDPSPGGDPQFRVLSLQPMRSGYARVRVSDALADLPLDGRFEREAALSIRCDARASDEPCTVGGLAVDGTLPIVTVSGAAGPLQFAISDVFPDEPPQRARALVRFEGGPELQQVSAGQRDALLDERAAAVVTIVERHSTGSARSVDAIVELGVDPSRDGWRYRGALISPGADLVLRLPSAVVRGRLITVSLLDSQAAER